MKKTCTLDADVLGLVVYLSQRQYNDKNLVIRADWLRNAYEDLKPSDLSKHIAAQAFYSLRPSERKALVLWVCKKIPPPEEIRLFLMENGFLIGRHARVMKYIRDKCREHLILYSGKKVS